ncbi:hypothetical protein AB3Z07_05180 [Metabacillus halosaccharovorans]|uniref:hypothetical protein n=1 Tax=Metabacillus halosaccharovorans TaxID=930124 RepID=UPI0034CF74A1
MVNTQKMVNYITAANVNFDFDSILKVSSDLSQEERENEIMAYNAKLQLFMELAIEEFVKTEFPDVILHNGVTVEIETVDEDEE